MLAVASQNTLFLHPFLVYSGHGLYSLLRLLWVVVDGLSVKICFLVKCTSVAIRVGSVGNCTERTDEVARMLLGRYSLLLGWID